MDVVRAEVVEHVHLVDDVLPVGRGPVEAELVGRVGQRVLVAADEHVLVDVGRFGEEHGQAVQRVCVGLAHEAVAEHTDIEGHSRLFTRSRNNAHGDGRAAGRPEGKAKTGCPC